MPLKVRWAVPLPSGRDAESLQVLDGTAARNVVRRETSGSQLRRAIDDEAHFHPVHIRNDREPQ